MSHTLEAALSTYAVDTDARTVHRVRVQKMIAAPLLLITLVAAILFGFYAGTTFQPAPGQRFTRLPTFGLH